MFQFKLNNIIVSQPEGWDTFSETLELDDTLFGILPKFRSKITFTGGGYDIIRAVRDDSGYCNTVTIEILEDCSGNYQPLFSGFIFISDCQFTRDECMVECEVEDDSYSARINNNQKLLVNLASTRSKNGEIIIAPTPVSMTFHDPTGGAFANARAVYDLHDVYSYMIQFLTDGNMTFTSSWLDNLPDTEHIGILTGLELRSFGGDVPEIQFNDLMEEIHKKFNVWFTIEGSVFRLEQESYYRNLTASVTLSDIRGIKERFDNAKLYSKIKMGGDDTEDFNPPTTNIPTIRFLTFNKEEFQIQSVCNIDRTLDLRSKYIIDTNVIEHVLNTPADDQYDEDIILIQYTESTSTTTGLDYLGLLIPILGFNDELRNIEVATRFNLQGDIAFYIGDGNDLCQINLIPFTLQGVGFLEPIPFDDQISDPGGNFRVPPEAGANPNYTYRAPANGLYSFQVVVAWILSSTDFQNNNRAATVDIKRYTAGGGLIQSFSTIQPMLQTGLFSLDITQGLYMDATDYLAVRVTLTSPNPADTIQLQGSLGGAGVTRLLCTAAETGAGIVQEKAPSDYFVGEYEFKTCISRQDWAAIRLDIAKSVIFGGDPKRGWTKSIEHKYSTGETEFTLLSNE